MGKPKSHSPWSSGVRSPAPLQTTVAGPSGWRTGRISCWGAGLWSRQRREVPGASYPRNHAHPERGLAVWQERQTATGEGGQQKGILGRRPLPAKQHTVCPCAPRALGWCQAGSRQSSLPLVLRVSSGAQTSIVGHPVPRLHGWGVGRVPHGSFGLPGVGSRTRSLAQPRAQTAPSCSAGAGSAVGPPSPCGRDDTVVGTMVNGGRVRKEGAAWGPYGFSLQCLQSAEGVPEKAAHLSGQGRAAPAEKGYTAA